MELFTGLSPMLSMLLPLLPLARKTTSFYQWPQELNAHPQLTQVQRLSLHSFFLEPERHLPRLASKQAWLKHEDIGFRACSKQKNPSVLGSLRFLLSWIVNQGAVGEEGQPMISQFRKKVKRKKKNRKSEHDLWQRSYAEVIVQHNLRLGVALVRTPNTDFFL